MSAQKSLKKLVTELQSKERDTESLEADLKDLLEGKEGSGHEAETLKQQQMELQQEIKEVKTELDDKQGQVCVRHSSLCWLGVQRQLVQVLHML